MKIAVLSGKGGTGKTTVSNNLAALVPEAVLIDCDVEEPNSHIFMVPLISGELEIQTRYPVIDEEKCIHCQKCAHFCRFNAIIAGPSLTMPLKDLCHDCGGCELLCPVGAISYENKDIGRIYSGTSRFGTRLIYGQLHIAELVGVKIINELNRQVKNMSLVIADSPPGTSCATVAALDDCDFALIVTEPTPFGVSDMKMVVELLRGKNIPFTVVINKAGLGNNEVYQYCNGENILISGEIPFDRSVARAYATGELAVEIDEEHRSLYLDLWRNVFAESEMNLED